MYVVKRIKLLDLDVVRQKRVIESVRKWDYASKKLGVKLAISLNDIQWELLFPPLFDEFPKVQFFGFTSQFARMKKYCRATFPYNYHLTFSSPNDDECKKVLANVGNVARTFKVVPEKKWGYPVYIATNQFRFLDDWGVIALPSRSKK